MGVNGIRVLRDVATFVTFPLAKPQPRHWKREGSQKRNRLPSAPPVCRCAAFRAGGLPVEMLDRFYLRQSTRPPQTAAARTGPSRGRSLGIRDVASQLSLRLSRTGMGDRVSHDDFRHSPRPTPHPVSPHHRAARPRSRLSRYAGLLSSTRKPMDLRGFSGGVMSWRMATKTTLN